MSYHEAFWVVAGTAAPVIALAAVVAMPEAAAAQNAALENMMSEVSSTDPTREIRDEYVRLWRATSRVRWLSVVNVVAQAGLLVVALSALAISRCLMPPWVAIVLAVGGILLLAWTLAKGIDHRKRLRDLGRKAFTYRNFDRILTGEQPIGPFPEKPDQQ